MVSDDLVKRLLANGLDECDEAVARIEALQAEIGILRTEKHADAEAIGHLQAQLAKAREDALREAANFIRVKQAKQKMACVVWPEEILALIDTPTPAPSPDALVKSALEWVAEQINRSYGQPTHHLHKTVCTAATDPATVAAIIERAGE
jgi:hypothetical protein